MKTTKSYLENKIDDRFLCAGFLLDSDKVNTSSFSEQIYFSIVGFQDGQINFDKSPRFAAEAEGHRGKKYRRRNKTTQDGIRGNRIIFTVVLIFIRKYFHYSKNVYDDIRQLQIAFLQGLFLLDILL